MTQRRCAQDRQARAAGTGEADRPAADLTRGRRQACRGAEGLAGASDQEIKAQILDIEGGKIRLSITAVGAAEERAELDAWKKSQKTAGGKGFGTFADLLKGKKLV